jgi:hypothetical protein
VTAWPLPGHPLTLCLGVLRILQDLVDQKPCVWILFELLGREQGRVQRVTRGDPTWFSVACAVFCCRETVVSWSLLGEVQQCTLQHVQSRRGPRRRRGLWRQALRWTETWRAVRRWEARPVDLRGVRIYPEACPQPWGVIRELTVGAVGGVRGRGAGARRIDALGGMRRG